VESFTGKLAVVTAGGSGIGRELVRQLAAQGCSVAARDLNADASPRPRGHGPARLPDRLTHRPSGVGDQAPVIPAPDRPAPTRRQKEDFAASGRGVPFEISLVRELQRSSAKSSANIRRFRQPQRDVPRRLNLADLR
jgi:hypothetical protein